MTEVNNEVIQPSTETTEQSKTVTMTQEKLDEIVKSAMGRAAKDVRIERDLLVKQLEEARIKQTPTDSEEQARNDARRLSAENGELKDRLTETQKTNLVDQICGDRFVDKAVVKALIGKNLAWDDTSQDWRVVNMDGSEKMNSEYRPMRPSELIEELAASKPYLVKSDVRFGNASSESSRSSLSNGKSQIDVATIFGPKSDSELANQLAKTNMPEYQRLKSLARSRGLVR